jgi:hypothetical protein
LEVDVLGRPYQCPICRSNGEEFSLVFKLAQEIRKDPDSGEILYSSPELETVFRADGRPDLDVRCGACGYVGQETAFVHEAQRRLRRRA